METLNIEVSKETMEKLIHLSQRNDCIEMSLGEIASNIVDDAVDVWMEDKY